MHTENTFAWSVAYLDFCTRPHDQDACFSDHIGMDLPSRTYTRYSTTQFLDEGDLFLTHINHQLVARFGYSTTDAK